MMLRLRCSVKTVVFCSLVIIHTSVSDSIAAYSVISSISVVLFISRVKNYLRSVLQVGFNIRMLSNTSLTEKPLPTRAM